jgi:probable phosphoglycerate mutase
MVHSTLTSDIARDIDPRPGPGAGPGAGPVLWLVRHGESTWNIRGLAQGHCDQARLTPRGVRQAWDVASQLHDRPIRALYASDLRRALETAAPLATAFGLPVTCDAGLRERSLGVLEGTASAAISPADSGLSANRVIDADAWPEGGESLRDFYRRVAAFTDGLMALLRTADTRQAGDVVVVAHGGTLRMMNARLHGVAVEQMTWEPLENGRILRWSAR